MRNKRMFDCKYSSEIEHPFLKHSFTCDKLNLIINNECFKCKFYEKKAENESI